MAMRVFLADSWMVLSLVSTSRIRIYEPFIRYAYVLYFLHPICIIKYFKIVCKFITFIELNLKIYV